MQSLSLAIKQTAMKHPNSGAVIILGIKKCILGIKEWELKNEN